MKTVLAALVIAVAVPFAVAVAPSDAVHAAPPGDDEVVAFVVRGVGNGHGRGMSQWGAYGRAIAGHGWQDILAAYYGGTDAGSIAAGRRISVKLNSMDGLGTVGVMSTVDSARWRPAAGSWSATTGSVYVDALGGNRFDVYTSPDVSCSTSVPDGPLQQGDSGDDVRRVQSFLLSDGFSPGAVDGQFGPMTEAAVVAFQQDAGLDEDGRWEIEEADEARARLAGGGGGADWTKVASSVEGPIEFDSPVSPGTTGEALGLCQPNGTVIHYRGTIRLFDTYVGMRTVNELDIEEYLRGVVPKEVPPSWAGDGGGTGANALAAQSVAARSFAVAQNRNYWVDAAKTQRYATTCDSPSCQVYGGAAKRTFPASTVFTPVEHQFTDTAIDTTTGVVRVWPGSGEVVSTEFSASNGPRTAGGVFPAVDDPFDDVPNNPNHRWTRIIDADSIRARYGLASANDVRTRPDTTPLNPPFEGIWANEVVLGEGKAPVSAWDFRNAFGLKAPGFELIPVRRSISNAVDFAFVGDSVGVSVAGLATSEFPVLTEGNFSQSHIDVLGGRRTQGGASDDGVLAASKVPVGTDIVLVELGYNDTPSQMPGRIDAVMTELRSRSVGLVMWVTVSERASYYAPTNQAIRDAADRWGEMIVIDWNAASDHTAADRWFSDDVHLTATGQAEFAIWLRDAVLTVAADGYTPPRPVVPGHPLRVPVLGVGGVPESGVVGVALNVTSVGPVGPGFLRVWPCGSVEPETSSVNFVAAGSVEPNAVVVPVDSSGEVCVSSLVATDVLVDVTGWFDTGVRAGMGRLVDTRGGERVVPGEVLRVPVLGVGGVPESGVVGVALNVTSVRSVGPGFLRVWPCGSVEPGTSSVNFVAAGSVEPNAVVVPVDGSGEVCVSSLVATDVLVDVTGWFDSGVRGAAGRLVDTCGGDRVVPGEVLRVPVLGVGGVPESGVVGVALNVTSVRSVGPGFLRVWPCGSVEPGTSSVNFVAAGSVEPNAVVVPVDGSGEVCVSSLVATDVLVDVTGWFDTGLRSTPGGRIVDTRVGIGPIPAR